MTTRNRTAVKRRIEALAAHALVDFTDGQGRPIAVSYTWNGDEVTDSTFFLGPIEGPSEPTSVGSSGKTRTKDDFTIKGYIQVNGYKDAEEAEAAAETALVAFEEYLGSAKNLRHPDVPFDASPDFDGVESPYIGNVDGPRHSFPQGLLVYGWIEFDITCTTRIH